MDRKFLDSTPAAEVRPPRAGRLRTFSHSLSKMHSKSVGAVGGGSGGATVSANTAAISPTAGWMSNAGVGGSSSGVGGGFHNGSSSKTERRQPRDVYARPIAEIPPRKLDKTTREPTIEASRGVLYSLLQLHPHILSLVGPVGENLGYILHTALANLDQLSEFVRNFDTIDMHPDSDPVRGMVENARRECATAIVAYMHVVHYLQQHTNRIASSCDPRYVRTLLLMIHGSVIELRNVCHTLDKSFCATPFDATSVTLPRSSHSDKDSIKSITDPSTYNIPKQPSHASLRSQFDNINVTSERPPPVPRRLRTDNSQSTLSSHPPAMSDTSMNGTLPPSTSIHSSHLPPQPPAPLKLSRSRSSSRSNGRSYSSMQSSLVNSTSRSGDTHPSLPSNIGGPSFSFPTNTNHSSHHYRPGSLDELDQDEEAMFDKICLPLTSAYTLSLETVPRVSRFCSDLLEGPDASRVPPELRALWTSLVNCCRVLIEHSELLQARLTSLRTNEITAPELRNQRDFWQLCKVFFQAFVDLVLEIRKARKQGILSHSVVVLLRPLQRSCREACKCIDASPWLCLVESSLFPPSSFSSSASQQPSSLPPQQQQHSTHISGGISGGGPPPIPPSSSAKPPGSSYSSRHHKNTSNSSAGVPSSSSFKSDVSSPRILPVQATVPLVPALGPAAAAAQSTVPSNEKSFASDSWRW